MIEFFDLPNEQLQPLMSAMMTIADRLVTVGPSLDPNFEKVVDLNRATIGGMLAAVSLLFGKDAANQTRQALLAAVRDRHNGAELRLSATWMEDPNAPRAFREWLTQNSDWIPPRD